ncbi:MAG TPA: DUF167 domain-containing protein [Leptospiraceae bacterium]|nr:DUF167 domain-containing protein [Leptospiraceae bacterium]HMW04862.1 DUF167 domain-containing protein [Leptospiraceae bacterium]HMY30390.1 DUF167 domain-containing protein [Leptospiraceae bacterium]HMZ66824.1 DUF167 domain-containing protein [Leptospiraceae bacterium]HNA07077.1 DUF167 domain-containing protein [Leptospiraceae bacterium]
MKLTIYVKPNSKKIGIDIINEKEWIVRVKEPATEGKANDAVLYSIAEKLNLPKSKVKLIKGEKSKQKIVEIL